VGRAYRAARDAGDKILERFGGRAITFSEIDDSAVRASSFFDSGIAKGEQARVLELSELLTRGQLKKLIAGEPVVADVPSPIKDGSRNGNRPGSRLYLAHLSSGHPRFLLTIDTDRPRQWHKADIDLLADLTQRVFVRLERARSQEALARSEAQYSAIFNQVVTGIAQTDLTGRFTAVNERFCEITGRTADELLALRKHDITHPDDLSRSAELFDALARGGPDFVIEKRYVKPDGSEVWVSNSVSGIRDKTGALQSIVAVVIDITERRRADNELRKTQQLFDRFMQFLPGLAWIKDEDSRYVYANDAAAKTFGVSKSKLYGKTDDEIFLPEIAEAFKENDKAALEQGGLQAIETLRHRDGSLHYSIVSKFAIPLGDGGRSHIGGMAIDITEQRRAQNALRAKEAELQMIADTTPVILVRCSSDLRYQFINQAGAALFGKTPEEMTGKSIRGLMTRRGWSAIAPHIEQVLRGNSVEYEAQIPYPATGFRWMRVHYVPEIDPAGIVVGWIASIVDVTELRAAQQAMLQNSMLIELSTEPIFAWNLESGIVQWNKGAEILYGYTRKEALGRSSHELLRTIHGEDFRKFFRNLKRKRFWSGEVRHYTKDGREVIIESRQQLLDTATGSVVLETNRDITDRRRAEELLRRNERELRVLTDSMPAVICYVDADERYRFVNRTYTEWFGRSRDEIVGKTVRDVMGEQAYEEVRLQIRQALEGMEVTFESTFDHRDGGVRRVHTAYVPDIANDRSVRGFYGLISDITELTHSKELLRTAEHRLGMIVDTVRDYAVFSLNREGRIDSWSTGAEHIFGWGADEILGLPGEILFTPEDITSGVPEGELKSAREDGRASDERWHIRKDGSRFFASGVVVPLYVGNTLAGYAKVATDLTERQRHAEELQRAHDELEVRVAQRTRELAESNAALIQQIESRKAAEEQRIELLRRLVTSQEFERRRIARDIHDQLGQRLTALRLKIASLQGVVGADEDLTTRLGRLQEISEHLDAEVSFLAWELRPMALDDMGLTGALAAFVREWSRHHEIEADFHAASVPKTRVDPDIETHLYRITQEALNNITKHSEAQNVTVLLEKRGDELVLVIEDDGQGFDPSKAGTPDRSGQGLGLVGMRERAALAGGSLEIESARGNGTAIFVRVPYRADTDPLSAR